MTRCQYFLVAAAAPRFPLHTLIDDMPKEKGGEQAYPWVRVGSRFGRLRSVQHRPSSSAVGQLTLDAKTSVRLEARRPADGLCNLAGKGKP